MKYFLGFEQPQNQLIHVKIKIASQLTNQVFHLPKWRPGRYELQDYASKVADVKAYTQKGQPLPLKKLTTHSWELLQPTQEDIILEYVFFANQPDAGGSYLDAHTIYVNPINLLLYTKTSLTEACELHLNLPEGYTLAGSLGRTTESGEYAFAHFHELADTPFLAGKNLTHTQFEVENIPFHLWFSGDCHPDFPRMIHDFTLYTKAQLKLFGEFPVDEYHYLCLMLPYPYRHGVEHQKSTVIAMGPGRQLMHKGFYRSFLEICSHELFHTWNVKALRPKDMLPYDYERENYSDLHYITEGVTTYYGDLMLWKGGNWNFDEWIENVNGELKRHFGMGGKDFTSLEAASFDSWVNGYKQSGTPNRRISFYTKGCLVALLTDFQLRKATDHEASLDRVMKLMYKRYGKTHSGYGKEEYQGLLEELSGMHWNDFFQQYIAGTEDLTPIFQEFGQYMGLKVFPYPFDQLSETWWGMKIRYNSKGEPQVHNLLPDCLALHGGISRGDILAAVNGRKIDKNLEEWLGYLSDHTDFHLHYFHQGQLYETHLKRRNDSMHHIPQLIPDYAPTESQLQNREKWRSLQTD